MLTRGEYYGDKADVWAVGCILLEMVLGHERFCDIWMTSYDYDILQNKTQFAKVMEEAVETLPDVLNFSSDLNDFLMQFLRLQSTKRMSIAQICTHKWLEGSMDQELANRLANKLSRSFSRQASLSSISPLLSPQTSLTGNDLLSRSGSMADVCANPEFLKAVFDNLSERERRHMEDYILARQLQTKNPLEEEIGDGVSLETTGTGFSPVDTRHHVLSPRLPPIEPLNLTPRIDNAKHILLKNADVLQSDDLLSSCSGKNDRIVLPRLNGLQKRM